MSDNKKTVTFESKKQDRFLIYMDNIPSFVMKGIRRPLITVENDKYVWDFLEIIFYDSIEDSTSKKMYSFIKDNKVHFDEIKVDVLGPVGDVVETWIYKKCDVLEIQFCPLNWSEQNISTISVKFKVDDIILN